MVRADDRRRAPRVTARDRRSAAGARRCCPSSDFSCRRVPAEPRCTDVSFDVARRRDPRALRTDGRRAAPNCSKSCSACTRTRAASVRLNGRDLSSRSTSASASRPGSRWCPKTARPSGLVATMSVRENMTLSSLERLARRGYLSPAREAQRGQPHASTSCASRRRVAAAPIGCAERRQPAEGRDRPGGR